MNRWLPTQCCMCCCCCCLQVRLRVTGQQTVLGDAAAAAELFVTEGYSTAELSAVSGVLDVARLSKRMAVNLVLYLLLPPPLLLPLLLLLLLLLVGAPACNRPANRPRGCSSSC